MQEAKYVNDISSDRLLSPAAVEVSRIADLECGVRTVVSREPLISVLYLYLTEGTAAVTLSDAGELTMSGGDVLVVFPGRVVSVELTGESNRLMLVALKGPGAVEASLRFGFHDLFRAVERYSGDFMSEIIACYEASAAHGRDPVLLNLVEHLLTTVWLRARHGGSNGPLLDALRTLNNLPLSGLTTEAAAQGLGISRSKLNTLFLSGMNMRPGEYISRIVGIRALAMLYWTKSSVAQIAKRTGFSSVSSFAVFLRRIYGFSPSEFRDRPIH